MKLCFLFQIIVFVTHCMISVSFAYEVGVDYHAYGANFSETAFLTQSHNSTVRSTVLVQLQGIADKGGNFVTLDIWFGNEPGTISNQYWLATFPISEQEKINLHQYTEDVASIQSKIDGHRLKLNIVLFG
jgi:hypothetical protein